MKHSLVVIGLMITMSMYAQTQSGYVKTRGRLNVDGTVEAGVRLPAASVTVRGRNTVTSGKDGSFRVPLNAQDYYLESVRKQGYVLSDPDVLSHRYAYSKNPLVLVMETPSQQADDKLAAERKIRRTLQRQLQSKEDEIEKLKEEKRISDEEYRSRLQEVYSQQEENEQLIGEMAERYSKIDYDQLDEFNRRVSALILEGELTKADSLIQTKGNIENRAETLKRQQAINAREEAVLTRRQRRLEKSKALATKELEELARDCYSKFEIFKMRHQNDSAAYYILLRAELDTLNVDWLLEAGEAFREYIADFNTATRLYENAIRISTAIYGNQSRYVSLGYNGLATILIYEGEYEDAKDILDKAYEIQEALGESLDASRTLNDMGCVYYSIGESQKAEELFERSLLLSEQLAGSGPTDITASLLNLSVIRHDNEDFDEAIELCEQVIEMERNRNGGITETLGAAYNSMGLAYKLKADSLNDNELYGLALEMYQTALTVYSSLYGENHPDVAMVYSNIGGVYDQLGDYPQALDYELKDLGISTDVLGKNDPSVATSYNNIGMTYKRMGDYEHAKEYYDEALRIYELFYDEDSVEMGGMYANLGIMYKQLGDYKQAYDYLNRAVLILKKARGESHSIVLSLAQSLNEVVSLMDKDRNKES